MGPVSELYSILLVLLCSNWRKRKCERLGGERREKSSEGIANGTKGCNTRGRSGSGQVSSQFVGLMPSMLIL